jgi:outer membrane protein OmpU
LFNNIGNIENRMKIMKKLLLGTTGLVAATMFASTVSAQTPKVTIGGFANFEAGVMNDDLDANQRSQGFRNDTELSFRVDGKLEGRDLGYGAVADLEADVSGDANNDGFNSSRTYVYLDGTWGRFELGSNQGATSTMRVDASTLAAASGGIDGSWNFFANNTAVSNFITRPALVTEHGSTRGAGSALFDNSQDNANKITYYSPRYEGFQLGLSYQPDQTDRGQVVSRNENNAGQSGDIFDGGVNYQNQFGDWSLAAALTGQMGSAETRGTEDLQAWNAGALVGYSGFKLAASYGDWADSNLGNGADASYWTVGGGYDYGAFGSSVTYIKSEIQNAARVNENEFDNIVVGVDYKLAPGLTPYAEWSIFNFDAGNNVRGQNNNGQVFIVGTQVAF